VEWWLVLLIIFGSLIVLMATGMPIAFCFMLINMVGVFIIMGGEIGLRQLGLSIFNSVATFTFVPIPLFILMGEVLFHSGSASLMIEALDKWMGRLPGRLALLSVAAGTLFASLTGSSLGSTAMLGSTLVPEMEKRGYKAPMSLGPILGSGGLAMMIPPSATAVLLAATAEISVGRTLMAICVPGLLMATLYAAYIITRCWLQPSVAAPYEVVPPPLSEKLLAMVRNVLPVGFVIFMVIGLIFMGVASPTEAAATGALSTFILAAFYRRLNWSMIKKSVSSSMLITAMIFLIMTAAKSYSEILAFSGASRGMVEFVASLQLPPITIIIAIMAGLLVLGMFITASAIILITVPLLVPIVQALGFDPVWFAAIMMINLEMGASTPPFGAILFVMKGVAPPDTTMGDIYRSALPFLCCDAIAMALIIAFPMLALWMPGVMH